MSTCCTLLVLSYEQPEYHLPSTPIGCQQWSGLGFDMGMLLSKPLDLRVERGNLLHIST